MNTKDSIIQIRPDTSIRSLCSMGIVPDWMYRDCDIHGMDEAENILCEWDWDWNWDLGDGYNKQQLEILANVRKIISEGINAFENDPEAQRQYREEKKKDRFIYERTSEYNRTFYKIADKKQIRWMLEYEYDNGHLPCFFIVVCRLLWHTEDHTDRLKAALLATGIGVDNPLPNEEIVAKIPTVSAKQIAYMLKKPYSLGPKFQKYIDNLRLELPERPLPESDPFWQQLIERQRLAGIAPIHLMRIVAYFLHDYLLEHSDGVPTLLPAKNKN